VERPQRRKASADGKGGWDSEITGKKQQDSATSQSEPSAIEEDGLAERQLLQDHGN
jgi:hypothetical protein